MMLIVFQQEQERKSLLYSPTLYRLLDIFEEIPPDLLPKILVVMRSQRCNLHR